MLIALISMGAVVPREARADLPSGVQSCSFINGVYTCYGYDNTTCTDVQGVYTCVPSTGGGTGGLETGISIPGFGKVPAVTGASGSGWLSKLTGWFSKLFRGLLEALVAILKDLVTFVLGVVLDLVASAIAAIGAPNFLQGNSLGNTLGKAGPMVGFFMAQLRIPEGLAMIGAGYVFRLTRKFLTLFQW